jgi:hypothetical protein
MFFLVIILYVLFGHYIVCSLKKTKKNKQKKNKKEQTIKRPKRTFNIMTKKNIQYNDQKEHTI